MGHLLAVALVALTTSSTAAVPVAAQLEGVTIEAKTCSCRTQHGTVVLKTSPALGRPVPSKHGDAVEALLSPDRRIVAIVRGEHLDGRFAKRELELVSLRAGELVTKRVDIEMPFVRDVRFLDDKRLVADVGGLHFAGVLILVDPLTGTVRERYAVASGGPRPEWVVAYDRLTSVPTP